MGTCNLLFSLSSAISPHFWPLQNPSFSLSLNPNLPFRSYPLRRFRAESRRRWDSDAETVRPRSFGFDNADDGDAEDEEDDVWSASERGHSGLLDEIIENVWIFKVLSSYGWLLPGIILSMLLATGPKAFLMALALPLGQSAISFVFNKFWGSANSTSKRKARAKKKRPFGAGSRVKKGEEGSSSSSKARKGKVGHQSWSSRNDGSFHSGGQRSASFGGWEELDVQGKFEAGSTGRRQQQTSDLQKESAEMGKFSRREGRGEAPLLLRLLLAAFPFLASWTKAL